MAPPAKVVGKRNSEIVAKVRVVLRPGFHVNSNKPSDDYLIPLRLTWEQGILQAESILFPKPHMEKYAFSDKPLSVFTGDFDLVTHFSVPLKAPVGPGELLGKLRYQACNDHECFPPKTVEIRLPYQIH